MEERKKRYKAGRDKGETKGTQKKKRRGKTREK
jgi:hypothetical protein